MSRLQPAVGQQVFLPKAAFPPLIGILRAEDYTVVAPTAMGGVIELRPIESADQLARGLRDEQRAGHYRLHPDGAELFFQYVVGPDSPKRHLFPPSQPLFKLRVAGDTFAVANGPPSPPKLAFVAIRPCDLAALQVLDMVFADQSRCESDVYYTQARHQMLIVVVNCTRPNGTCFCASMGTGPRAPEGYDLALTELRAGFLVKVGSARGAQLAAKLDVREPSAAELELAEVRLDQAQEHMGRALDTRGLPQLLEQAIDHPHWDAVAQRCLACGNCTMVCPTCFCSGIADANTLTGGEVSRTRLWDSCYTHQFSYTTAGPVRSSIRARHRHKLRHKLGTWWQQFGTSGCVGCGRCITWCPVGIDLTEEIAEIRAGSSASDAAPPPPPRAPTRHEANR